MRSSRILLLLLTALAVFAPRTDAETRAVLQNPGALRSFAPSDGQSGERGAKRIRLRFQLAVPGQGKVPVVFTARRTRDWPAIFTSEVGEVPDSKDVALFQGELLTRTRVSAGSGRARRSVPAAGALYRNGSGYVFELTYVGETISRRPRYYQIRGQISSSDEPQRLRVRRVPTTVLDNRACGLRATEPFLSNSAGASSAEKPTIKEGLLTVEIATDADFSWFQTYGSNSNATIASAINAADAIYRDQLGLTFQIKKQASVTSSASNPYTSNDSDVLIEQFRQFIGSNPSRLGDADIYHLFSRKTLLDNVIGIAYTGVVCSFPAFSFGLTTDVLASITFAHEVGHNFDAQHASSGIMSAALSNPPPQTFSSASISEILGYVASNNSCLSEESDAPTATPTPTPTSTPSNNPPQATPTPTPTIAGPSNPGGDPGGGSDDPAGIVLNAKLKRNGRLDLDVDLGTVSAGCSLTILASKTSAGVYASGMPIATNVPTSGTFSLSIEKLEERTAPLTKKGKPRKVFFGARLTCPGSVRISPPRAVRSGAPAKGRRVSPNAWIKYLDGLLD